MPSLGLLYPFKEHLNSRVLPKRPRHATPSLVPLLSIDPETLGDKSQLGDIPIYNVYQAVSK